MTLNQAIDLFDGRARAVLIAAGQRGTHSDVARALGIDRSRYANVRSGNSGSWDTLVDWLKRWRAAGHPSLGVLAMLSARVEGE